MSIETAALRIRTPRLLLRIWRESDAAALSRTILDNFEHLRPWFPWAEDRPQQDEKSKLEFIRKSRRESLRGKSIGFAIFDRDEAHLLGAIGLNARIGSGAREIGYWLHKDHCKQGLTTEAAAALTRLCFERLGMRFMEIHCDPANRPSAAVARKLGYSLRADIRHCVPREAIAPRDSQVWMMHQRDWLATPAASVTMQLESECEPN